MARNTSMNNKDEMAHKYGGMTSSGEYIKPNTAKFAKEHKMFASAKKEIGREKRKESAKSKALRTK